MAKMAWLLPLCCNLKTIQQFNEQVWGTFKIAEYTKGHMSASGSVAVGGVSTLAQREAA